MNLENTIPSEISQKEEDKYHYNITYMWNQKKRKKEKKIFKWTYFQIRKRFIDMENKLMITKGERTVGDCKQHMHTTIYKIDN